MRLSHCMLLAVSRLIIESLKQHDETLKCGNAVHCLVKIGLSMSSLFMPIVSIIGLQDDLEENESLILCVYVLTMAVSAGWVFCTSVFSPLIELFPCVS